MDKLDHPVTVKFCERGIRELKAMADARGLEVSEYIRDLVFQDKHKAKAQFDALCVIFLQDVLDDHGNKV